MTAIQARLYKHDKRIEKKVKGWILDHLMRLSVEDRNMRFFSALGEAGLKSYIDKIREEDEIFLTMDTVGGKLRVTGFLHVASLGDNSYEIGVSVDADQRQHGIGSQLFDRAMMFLKGHGCKKLYINCLTINTPMQKIVKKYSMEAHRDPEDRSVTSAYVEMDPIGDFFSLLKGNSQDQIALFGIAMKAFL